MNDTLHSKRCLAEAIISAVQNIRDNPDVGDLTFRIAAQDNAFLPEADDYLSTGLQTCTCGAYQEDEVVELFKTDPTWAQQRASDYLRQGRITPEGYLRIARRTQAMDPAENEGLA